MKNIHYVNIKYNAGGETPIKALNAAVMGATLKKKITEMFT